MADKLLQIARTDRDAELRRAPVRNLGVMRAERTGDTLKTVYAAESDPTVKKEAINALFAQQNAEALVDIARKRSGDEARDRVDVLRPEARRSRLITWWSC
jgi:hypothetical protein